jgi:adenylate cyclase
MTKVIMDHDGTVDKFLGDGIMAYWGAPLAQKNHAALAINCTLKMATTMEQLQQKWQAANVPGLSFRIGIHSGEAIAGNIGAQGKKMEYTVIGDTVNLASRLEGTAKYYGVDILVSETTRQAAGETFLYRELDRIRVVGKSVPITIFELLGQRNALTSSQDANRTGEFGKGLIFYRACRFTEALAVFAAILADMPQDTPSLLYKARCEYFLANPPSPEWDGVFDRRDK